ncbi:hypothetical protein MJA45_03915 [Paenibacillus aurantius]|uniref:DUF3800 domain-containing protein n=1 Tax=Paenibacillus aurantius TaxID=2918900 RepID=A0AA96RFN5_9BACL|nr:hypothetical protein [Paenibacillus aurantius]WNQ12207.1 hypothetical protein MJA45_03915 [Paenibacillus aurantius]
MSKYSFYYDESEHSRKINHKTITAENYFDSFIAVVVGWPSNNQAALYERYATFESKYLHRQSNGELKSTTIKQSQLKSGFASLNADNLSLLEDFLALFDERILVYYAVTSKIEYIIHQLFEDYENSLFVDMDAMKYSITKAIVLYQPSEIMAGMYNNTSELIGLLKDFFTAQIEKGKANETLKQKEIVQFSQILLLLDDVSTIKTIDWNYDIAFVGFRKFLDEKGIHDYSITIDKEGEHCNTVKAAERVGLCSVSEADSLTSCGIRMADMLAGIISKLLKALHSALEYASPEELLNKKILDKSWFLVNERQLALYKKLHQMAIELNKTWYKAFAGTYSDDLIGFIALLSFMNHFKSVEDINKDLDMQGEYFNAYCCEHLGEHFEQMRYGRQIPALPIDAVTDNDLSNGFVINRRGAKVYFDIDRQPLLEIKNGHQTFDVLSVGLSKEMIPVVTIVEEDEVKCYRIPKELSEWTMTFVGLANMGENVFPSKVVFSKTKDGYVADIL